MNNGRYDPDPALSLTPQGDDNRAQYDNRTFGGPTPPADAMSKADPGPVRQRPTDHAIPARRMWPFSSMTPGEEYNEPFGDRDGDDFDDVITY